MTSRAGWFSRWLAILLALGPVAPGLETRTAHAEPPRAETAGSRQPIRQFVDLFCVDCHNPDDRTGNLDLETADLAEIDQHPETWEKVVRKLSARQMPPADAPRPRTRQFDAILASLTTILDRAAAEHPRPGRVESLRRMTRLEYQNAIRDLLALDVDASTLLPDDPASHGFDNITVGDLSPTLLDRYLTAARKIARLAVGGSSRAPGSDTIRLRPDLTQEEHVEGLPLGTRGGAVVPYTFPRDGDYEIELRLTRDRNEHIEGLREPHELEILMDREPRARFTLDPPHNDREHETADAGLRTRIAVKAGPRRLGVTFRKKPSSLLETRRQPYQAHFNMHRHPRQSPALFQITITGPFHPEGPGDTPSRRRVFVVQPTGPDDEEAAARRILSNLVRRAYRRPADDDDLVVPLELYRRARAQAGFDAGIELALSSILVNPRFLFRIEADPPDRPPGSVYPIDDFALASRLSFFLWSSIPDDTLLNLAEQGQLARPEEIDRQVRRMLADPRASNLATNFAGQWLHLRNLDSITPDLRLFPDFDDNLRQAFRRETELLFEDLIREDRGVLRLITSPYTYLNERLAKHYGIPHVYGSEFRRVSLDPSSHRGGLLRQGGVLTVTSYATRTSPVIRGKWILENLLGTPPPPPPGDVPALKDNTIASTLSVRERLAEHRRDVACAGCHQLMDPVGFALENYDAVGRWRAVEDGRPIDVSGGLPDGRRFEGVDGLEAALLARPEGLVTTLAEKLLTFALGRGVEPADAPAIRAIVRQARANNDRISSLIVGIATSPPFLLRTVQ